MKNENPLVSIIMPAYNCEHFIRKAIDSVLAQEYGNFELLIADDASTDGTKALIDSIEDKRIKTFHNSFNQGYLKTCNKLFNVCSGDLIAFQDADDVSAKDRLKKQVEFLRDNNDVALCGTNLTMIDEEGHEKWCTTYPTAHETIVEGMKNGYFGAIPNSFVFERKVLEDIGGYNVFFDRIGVEDYYWTWCISQKYKIANLNYAGYYYRFNPNSVTGNIANNPSKINIGKILNLLIAQKAAFCIFLVKIFYAFIYIPGYYLCRII
jgi:glycosyltransferase involved in cell wall biosynthesis